MKVDDITTHGSHTVVRWCNVDDFAWRSYCLIFNKDFELEGTVEMSSNPIEVSVCSHNQCNAVIVKDCSQSFSRSFGCYSKSLAPLARDSLRSDPVYKIGFSFSRSLYYLYKCNLTCVRSYGSINLIGSNSGILFVVPKDSDNFDESLTAPVIVKVNTPCLPIINIDVSESETEFIIVCHSHYILTRISFPL